MRNTRYTDREKVRIDFNRSVPDAASAKAAELEETLSHYVEQLVQNDLGQGLTQRSGSKSVLDHQP